jgi:hypothetical protein
VAGEASLCVRVKRRTEAVNPARDAPRCEDAGSIRSPGKGEGDPGRLIPAPIDEPLQVSEVNAGGMDQCDPGRRFCRKLKTPEAARPAARPKKAMSIQGAAWG